MDVFNDFYETFRDLPKELLAEFIGTCFLVLVGCGSAVSVEGVTGSPSNLEIALCFGLSVGVIVHIIGHISGGHINPAVSVGMCVAGKINIIKCLLYIIFQLLGAIAGAALLYASLPVNRDHTLGQTLVNGSLNVGQAWEIEFVITFLLVFGVFMILDPSKHESRHEPMVIGLIVSTCHIWAIKYTGSSMNPARSFGPALISNVWTDHWVYWVGPIPAGVVAGLLYRFIFESSENPEEKSERRIAEDVEKQNTEEQQPIVQNN